MMRGSSGGGDYQFIPELLKKYKEQYGFKLFAVTS
jgi:hypothetical protein